MHALTANVSDMVTLGKNSTDGLLAITTKIVYICTSINICTHSQGSTTWGIASGMTVSLAWLHPLPALQ